MRRHIFYGICLTLLWSGLSEAVTRFALPVAAGVWYPADKAALESALKECMKDARPPAGERMAACIVPHAPYQTSGAIAGAALGMLQPGQYDRVIVLGASHRSSFRGCSIPSVEFYQTPLGSIPLDGQSIRQLDLSPLIEVRSVNYQADSSRVQVHEIEYSIEATLPFLQERLGTFRLIPILVGDFLDYQKKTDVDAIEAVAKSLHPLMDDRTLLVVSSDFTHYGNNFSYRPFKENIIESIEALDKEAFRLILTRDFRGFVRYLDDTRNPICAKNAIAILLRIVPKSATGRLLAHDISARKTGDTRTSISFASLAFFVPDPAVEEKPE
ncbi:MAG TPA: AmmeMemoRadiSam system protein B [Candidatus Hydrogenedentes bacterium]|nr:AmmeMemoRadiSam system protein B [Candidatus Hydrogenedentota bacterium]HOV74719.1 AmmeMemoRadiSam system protein B [Candidatus Hydrogenedentota bacterium]HPC18080.1 AmmeMemoRadiSam system protein B [Candidatus Hydrogenedentota bacterium]HRT21706.1 AmmeMemoRadiSam system protein B [Candidatus Hydrogenedentota bacterium]HRT66547.1 AmmeMemoRadiSam system protein B [Candidatus Hydrogenedentota bacterium]